ncbi:MAG: hypothetical protein R3B13_30565 [Polyangiaceae bacterium]
MKKNVRVGWMSWLVAVGAACGSMSCATWFLKGAHEHKGLPPVSAVGVFRAPECTLADGKTIAGPDTTYHFARGKKGPELIEAESSGRSSAIDNYWRDAAGHNFATYVRGNHAWQYVIPDDPEQPATRLVFTQYSVARQGSGFRLVGEPVARCPLVRQGVAALPPPVPVATQEPVPAPTPAPVPTSPLPPVEAAADAGAPATACVPGSTQECVGPGGCRGGQACLPDGSGFGVCDCGGQ